MEEQEVLFHKIAAKIPDAKEGKMFGALCIKAPNGKAAAMYYKKDMVFKLQGKALDEAMSLDGAQLFDPMGGRPMTGWVQLSDNYKDRWREFAAASMDYVRKLEK